MPSDNETTIRIWIAAYTGPNMEERTKEGVEALGYPVMLPTGSVEMVKQRRQMIVERPVFPRYLFIGVPEGVSWYPLRTVTGLQGVLSQNGEPQALNGRAVKLLRQAIDANAFTKKPAPEFEVGQRVEVMVGQTPVEAFVEGIQKLMPAQRIDVMFKMFGKEHRKTFLVDQVRAA